jgi:hypothetical protein
MRAQVVRIHWNCPACARHGVVIIPTEAEGKAALEQLLTETINQHGAACPARNVHFNLEDLSNLSQVKRIIRLQESA